MEIIAKDRLELVAFGAVKREIKDCFYMDFSVRVCTVFTCTQRNAAIHIPVDMINIRTPVCDYYKLSLWELAVFIFYCTQFLNLRKMRPFADSALLRCAQMCVSGSQRLITF